MGAQQRWKVFQRSLDTDFEQWEHGKWWIARFPAFWCTVVIQLVIFSSVSVNVQILLLANRNNIWLIDESLASTTWMFQVYDLRSVSKYMGLFVAKTVWPPIANVYGEKNGSLFLSPKVFPLLEKYS